MHFYDNSIDIDIFSQHSFLFWKFFFRKSNLSQGRTKILSIYLVHTSLSKASTDVC